MIYIKQHLYYKYKAHTYLKFQSSDSLKLTITLLDPNGDIVSHENFAMAEIRLLTVPEFQFMYQDSYFGIPEQDNRDDLRFIDVELAQKYTNGSLQNAMKIFN